ncbi:histidine kinase, partial [Frankia sp. AiPs1]|nr:histidine kinase [Frankia sp. AiPs1]
RRTPSLFGPPPAARDLPGGPLARNDPFTSPLNRPTGPRHEDTPGAGQSIVPLHRPAPPGGTGGADLAERGGQAPEEHTEVGLPRRTRRASLAPQLRRDSSDDQPGKLAAQRSPEEIRSMMSSFQSNFGRGLADGQVSNDGDDVGEVT